MTDEIKKRVTHLQNKEIPSGYKKTKAGIMPVDWDGTIKAKQVFKSHKDKKHDGNLEILAATQENGIVPRSQVDIDIKCSEEGVNGYKRVKVGDFVISLRSFQGGIEYSQYDGIVSPAYTVLEAIRPICDIYYRNYFKTSDFINRLNGTVYGIRDGKQISYEDFGDLLVHYPPQPEQEKIAEILLQCDKVIELKRQFIEEEKKKKKWIQRKLLTKLEEARTPHDKSAPLMGTLKDLVCNIESGTSVNSIDTAVEIFSDRKYVLKTSAISDGIFLISETKEIVPEDYSRISCSIEANTLLVSRMNTPKLVGACAICHATMSNVYLPDRLWKISVNGRIDPRWLNYTLNSNRYRSLIQKKAGGTSNSMKNISQKDFLNLPIIIPTYDDQVAVANAISSMDNVIQKLQQEVDLWVYKKKATMQLLLTGIVRVIHDRI